MDTLSASEELRCVGCDPFGQQPLSLKITAEWVLVLQYLMGKHLGFKIDLKSSIAHDMCAGWLAGDFTHTHTHLFL